VTTADIEDEQLDSEEVVELAEELLATPITDDLLEQFQSDSVYQKLSPDAKAVFDEASFFFTLL
jgi:hypothetical protein